MVRKLIITLTMLTCLQGHGWAAAPSADFSAVALAYGNQDFPDFALDDDGSRPESVHFLELGSWNAGFDDPFRYPVEIYGISTDSFSSLHWLDDDFAVEAGSFPISISRHRAAERDLLPSRKADLWRWDLPTATDDRPPRSGPEQSPAGVSGIDRNAGFYATSLISWLPAPITIDFGVHKLDGPYSGFQGIGNDRELWLEGGFTARLAEGFQIGAEYRQKSGRFSNAEEFDWAEEDTWALGLAYNLQSHVTISGGIFSFGEFLIGDDNSNFGMKFRFDF